MVFAYLRVSTGRQSLDNQRKEISKFADANNWKVDIWVTEVVSGCRKGEGRKLGELLRRLGEGDVLIVTELSRLSRTLTEIMSMVGGLLERNVRLYSTKDRYAFDDSINSKVLCFAFGLVAELERNLISARTREALAARKENGVVLGRKKGSITKRRRLIDNAAAIAGELNGGSSIASICIKYEVSRGTFELFRNSHMECTTSAHGGKHWSVREV